MLQRFVGKDLQDWLEKPHRKPLVVRGARQVGKSTLVRQLAKERGLRLFEVNLERHRGLTDVLRSLDPGKILRELEFLLDQGPVRAADSLLFFDEIQGVPEALQALRYFYEEMPELPVVGAGSLLEFALADHAFPMPVGRVEYFHLGPLSWEEFLAAKGEERLLGLIEEFDLGEHFPMSAHERLTGLLREYLLIGGMPEAVQLWVDHGDRERVFEIQEAIAATYRDDFSKYARGGELVRLHRVLDYLGRHVGEKVKYANIDHETQARELRKAIDLLLKAGVVFRVCHSHGDGPPLRSQMNERVFKLYHIDLGFFGRAQGLSAIRDKDLRDQRFINEGKLAEQFVAQQLYFAGLPRRPPELHYWLREGKTGNAEVDFLEALGDSVVPIEVKAGKAGSLKSLIQFAAQKKIGAACRFDLNTPSRQLIRHRMEQGEVALDLVSLPLTLCGQMRRLLGQIFI